MNSRTNNARRNIVYGILLKIYQIVVPFIIRTAMIYFMGVQYLGLNSLFTSVLNVLSLAELGISTAMVFAMYKPITENDTTTICALMRLYKIYYRIIGIVIACIGLAILPFIPKLIHGNVPPDVNIYILYLLNLMTTVLSYLMFAYKYSIFQAHQRTDIISRVGLISSTFQYIFQFLVLWIFKNYYYYLIVLLISQILNNIIVGFLADKYYPNYKAYGKLPENEKQAINQKIADLFTAKIGFIVNNSVDSVIISAFIGLEALGVYNNYFYIMNSVMGFVMVLFDSVTAGIGNSLITESVEKNYNDLKKFTFIIFWIINICSCCFLCLYQPFMSIWVGNNLMLSYGHVIAMTVLFCVQTSRKLWVVIKDAAGIWHQDKYRPLIVAGCNLFINIALVQNIGLYGIMLSTIIAELVISIPWLLNSIFKYVIPVEHSKYYSEVFWYTFVLLITSVLCVLICNAIDLSGIVSIAIYLLICIVLSNIIQLLVYRNNPEFKESVALILKTINKR